MSRKNRKQHAVVGAPAPLVIAAGDQRHTFLVNKPSAADLVTMQKWVLAQPVGNATQGICDTDLDGLSPERQILLLKEFAKAKAGKRTPTEAEVIELVHSPAGVAMQVWLAARRNHPGLSLAETQKLVTEENAVQVMVDLDAALTPALNPDADEGDDPKAPPAG